jgi:hypothetical protein
MKLDEARKVLNLEDVVEGSVEPAEYAKLINARYEKLYLANGPPSGSKYLQSKIFRAKESIEEDYKRRHGISTIPEDFAAKYTQEKTAAEATLNDTPPPMDDTHSKKTPPSA